MKKAVKPKATPKPETFILWNPASLKPPRKLFTSRAEAEAVAELCAPKYDGGTVFVAKLVFKAEREQERVTVLRETIPATNTKLD